MTKRTKLTVDQCKTAYLGRGIEGIEELTADHKDPRKTLRDACVQLNALFEVSEGMIKAANPEALSAYVDGLDAEKAEGRAAGGRGKAPPTVGTMRGYKAQLNKSTGTMFVYVPIPNGTLEVTPGDEVSATFEAGKIVLA